MQKVKRPWRMRQAQPRTLSRSLTPRLRRTDGSLPGHR
jgi:hypothetical protein